VKRVGQVLNYCADQASIGVITGDYGVGKTQALSYWRSKSGRTISHIYFEFDEFSARGVGDFLSCIAEQIGLDVGPVHNRNGGPAMRAIADYLATNVSLVILDQCEACSVRVLQVIRQIWDRARQGGTGIALLSSPMLVERLKLNKSKDLGALTSRVGIWTALQGVQKEEALDIVTKEGVRNIDDEAFDLLWRAVNGSMRRLMAVADLLVVKHGDKPVTARTIESLAGHLWGLNIVAGKRVTA
jgi:DNA transposition AAA+ family ATPase